MCDLYGFAVVCGKYKKVRECECFKRGLFNVAYRGVTAQLGNVENLNKQISSIRSAQYSAAPEASLDQG